MSNWDQTQPQLCRDLQEGSRILIQDERRCRGHSQRSSWGHGESPGRLGHHQQCKGEHNTKIDALKIYFQSFSRRCHGLRLSKGLKVQFCPIWRELFLWAKQDEKWWTKNLNMLFSQQANNSIPHIPLPEVKYSELSVSFPSSCISWFRRISSH